MADLIPIHPNASRRSLAQWQTDGLDGEGAYICGEAGYTRLDKRLEHQERQMIRTIAARPSSYKKHEKKILIGRMRRKIEYGKAQVWAQVNIPFA